MLAVFGKTKTLAPGESQTPELSFPISDMASYDDMGKAGHKSAYFPETGDYKIYVGNSIKNAGENGVHASERYDLLTTVARGEWGFDGYFTTNRGGYTDVPCEIIIKAGNGLILGHNTYGAPDQLKTALKDGTLKRGEIEVCIKRVLEMMLKTTAPDKLKDDAVKISSIGRTRIPAVEYVSASSGVGTEAVKTQDSSGNSLKDPANNYFKSVME